MSGMITPDGTCTVCGKTNVAPNHPFELPQSVTAPTPDAVTQAREDMVQSAFVDDSLGLLVIPAHKIDALIAAVRAECAAKVEGFADAYPTDVWPETPFTDAQAASVMRLMVPRILATLEAHP